MHSDSEQTSQSFETVREMATCFTVGPARRTNNSHSGQKYHNILAANRSSIQQSSKRLETSEDMSPRFLPHKENMNNNVHEDSRKRKTSDESILMSLPKQDLVQLVLNARKQLKQCSQIIDDKDNKIAKLKKQLKELGEEVAKLSSNNDKLIEYIKNSQVEKQSSRPISRNGSASKISHRKTHSTRHNSSQVRDEDMEYDVQTSLTQLLSITDSDNPSELMSKVKTLKQSGKFVCSLYKLIDQYTNNKYFNQAYSLSAAWSFVKKLFRQYFDESWIKSNSIVVQLEQLLNCCREQLNDRILNMMRDMSRMNRLLEKFKVGAGLFWINDLEELEKYVGKAVINEGV